VVLDGPDVEATGLSAWTLAELCQEVEQRWGVSYHPSHMGKLMHQLDLSWQKARPSHPKADAPAREAFAKILWGDGSLSRDRLGSGYQTQEAPYECDLLIAGHCGDGSGDALRGA
jgi:hypothetical protein